MRRRLYSLGVLALSLPAFAQITATPKVLCHVDNTAKVYVSKGALVYNGGGLQVKGTGVWENHGNVMVVASDPANDVFRTLNASGADKTEANAIAKTGGQFINALNEPTAFANPNTNVTGNVFSYGQLFISGITQNNIQGYVNQEHRNVNHGSYQQMALPFFDKTLSTLNTDLGKTFSIHRWSVNEIQKYKNASVVFDHYTSLSTKLSDPAGYYVLGNQNNTLDVSTVTRTLVGRPYADGVPLAVTLQNAGNGINWNNGHAKNVYNEKYNSYVQDGFELQSAIGGTAWQGNFGRNLYQFGNPFLTNLDLRNIFINEGANGDGVHLTNIYGVRVEQAPGTISYQQNVGGGAAAARYITWNTATNLPVGDIEWAVVRPMSVFTIKLKDNASAQTLDFNKLRRFNYTPRTGADYNVTAAKSSSPNQTTLKQLGIIALDVNGNEIGRTYYVVAPNGENGHQQTTTLQVASSSSDIIGTFEEDPSNGGYDSNYTSNYWLYINETNENFQGKEVPLALYKPEIKSLKFEIRENAELVTNGTHALSSGIGFYYKLPNGTVQTASHEQIIPVTVGADGADVALYYGAPNGNLASSEIQMPSRTMVAFNQQINQHVVVFDPNWKKATVKVFDMSGRLVYDKKNVETRSHHIIELNESVKSTYLVVITSESGVVVNAKIIK